MFQSQVAKTEPSPYEQALDKEGLDWLNATNGSKPLDVSSLSGMSPYMDLYRAASSDQKQQRYGLGSLRFGAAAANPNLISELSEQDKAHRTQEAGGELENAYNTRNAAVRGIAMPLIQTDAGRQEGVLNAIGGQASGARDAFARFQTRPGFWSQLLTTAVQSAGNALSYTIP